MSADANWTMIFASLRDVISLRLFCLPATHPRHRRRHHQYRGVHQQIGFRVWFIGCEPCHNYCRACNRHFTPQTAFSEHLWLDGGHSLRGEGHHLRGEGHHLRGEGYHRSRRPTLWPAIGWLRGWPSTLNAGKSHRIMTQKQEKAGFSRKGRK